MISYKNEVSEAHRLLESSLSGLKTSHAAASGYSRVLLNQPANLDLVAKTLNQPHSAEVREVRFLEGETDFLGPSGHPAQSTLLGAFVPWGFWCPNYSFLRSEN
jgi:hypothetical protein